MKKQSEQHYHGHRERLKERFMKEPSLVHNYELLEIILTFVIPRRDVKPIAKNILNETQSFINIFNHDLSNIDGIGKQTNIFFNAIKELFDRCEKEVALSSLDLNSSTAIYFFFKYSISLGNKENFAIVFLDTQNQLIHYEILSKDYINSNTLFLRNLAELAIKYNAINIVIVHNNPSGNLVPTDYDIKITHDISDTLATIDINLVDHIIISKNGYISLANLGLI